MSINIHNVVQEEEPDTCIICLESLESETQYSLPECSHCFHQNCIMHWFRDGNAKCPLCNNLGVNSASQSSNNHANRYWGANIEKYKLLRQYSRKKEAPVMLKKEIVKLKKMEENQKKLSEEMKTLKGAVGVFSEMRKKHSILRTKKWKNHRRIWSKKIMIAELGIVPIIIAKKATVN